VHQRDPAESSPVDLDAKAYRELCKEVLERDGWRCQSCGLLSAVEVHHKRFRSHQGADSKQSLITLDCKCHRKFMSVKNEIRLVSLGLKGLVGSYMGGLRSREDGNSSARPEPGIETIHRDLRRAKKANSFALRRKLGRLSVGLWLLCGSCSIS
jgi:hypothetical protein